MATRPSVQAGDIVSVKVRGVKSVGVVKNGSICRQGIYVYGRSYGMWVAADTKFTVLVSTGLSGRTSEQLDRQHEALDKFLTNNPAHLPYV